MNYFSNALILRENTAVSEETLLHSAWYSMCGEPENSLAFFTARKQTWISGKTANTLLCPAELSCGPIPFGSIQSL